MHNRNEVQPPISLPDLSTWHRVPAGATIPAGTPCTYAYEDGIIFKPGGHFEDIIAPDRDNSLYTYYTESPLAPPLPTEDGATILASGNDLRPHTFLTLEAGRWVNRFGAEWGVDDIRTWAPVTIGEVVVKP